MTGLRVGVVGMGIGQAHLLGWSEVDGASVSVIADIDEGRLKRREEAWNIPGVDSLDAVLASGVDIVDLCTPPTLHESQIEQCLNAGVHVICEKPLVDSVAACDRLRHMTERAQAASGARLMPILQYRFGDGAQRARALVESGLTGKLFTASASTWWRRGLDYYNGADWRGTWGGERGGTIVTHAIHIHDLLTWIGGPIDEVRALTTTRVNDIETEDCAVAVGRTTDGALMTMNVNVGSVTESSRLVWCFEHVMIESSTSPYHPAEGPWSFNFTDPDIEAEAERVFANVAPVRQQFAGQFQLFVDGLAADGPSPIELDDAQATLELITAWYRSARTGSVETLPLASDHPDRESWRPDGIR